MDQTLGKADSLTTVHVQPILLDASAVPRGQKLPVRQDHFQFVENNWVNQRSAFTNFSSSHGFTPLTISHTFPQVGPDPHSVQMSLEVTSDQADPVTFQPFNFDEAHRPPEPKCVFRCFDSLVKRSDSPRIDLTDSATEAFPNQQVIPLSQPQSATSGSGDLMSGNETNPVPEVLSNSHFLGNDSQCDKVSPLWLDLFLDASNNLSFPDADLESVLSLETGSF